jgi:lysine 2,3-aminomutase
LFNKTNIQRLFSINHTIKSLLADAQSVAEARQFLITYINEYSRALQRKNYTIPPLEFDVRITSLKVFRKMISPRSERLASFCLVSLLWNLAHDKQDSLPEDLSNGFFEELIHLLKGINGTSGIYADEEEPTFAKLSSREAAIARSDQLDQMARDSQKYIKRYPTGLDPLIIERRLENKKRIQQILGATDKDWQDYHWQIRNVVRDAESLEKLIELTDEDRDAINKAKSGRLPFGITPYYVALMDKEPDRNDDHAIRAQVMPPMNYVDAMLANRENRNERFDFMLEADTSPIDLITRRYPNICILKPFNTCSQICVYCQRNWEIDDVLDGEALATKSSLIKAIQWIKEHEQISEILVTGGDPLVMNDNRLDFILSELSKIEHIERIRIGSRTPVVLPQRITDELLNVVSKYHEPGRREIVLVTHYEHAYEVTRESMEAVQKFKRAGISVYNQAVFTVENSRRFELVALRRVLRLIGVDPYYTFNTKGKKETKNYRAPLARLMQEVKEEARIMPGMMRTDEAVYNVPGLGKNYVRAQQHHSLITILPNGSRVYEFHPWEKKLELVDTFVDVDVPIYDFLMELERRGEDIEDYKSIWYYY